MLSLDYARAGLIDDQLRHLSYYIFCFDIFPLLKIKKVNPTLPVAIQLFFSKFLTGRYEYLKRSNSC